MLVQNIQCPSSGKPKSYLSQLLQYLYMLMELWVLSMPDLSRVRTQRQIFGFRKCRQVCRPIDTRELARAYLVNFKIYVIE